jgi:nucleoside-diphosphate-sugar epimerase
VAAASEQARGRIYHVCEEPTLTELEWMKGIAAQTEWTGRFVLLPTQQTPKHLSMPFEVSQHVVADSERIRKELGYREPVGADEAMRRTVAWERTHPPAGPSFHQFDYEAEDRALA